MGSTWVTAIENSWRDLLEASRAFAPALVGALLLLLLGWLLASGLRRLILRLGARIDRVFYAVRDRFGQAQGELRWPVSRVLSSVVYWLTILFALTAASRLLALPGLADVFTRALLYLPQLFAWSLELLVVYAVSRLAASRTTEAAQAAGMASAVLLGRAVRGFLLLVGCLLIATQIGLDVSLLSWLVAIATGVLLGGGAIAFGIGAGGAAGDIIAAHHVRQHYAVGQRVAVESFEGEILEITRAAVILDAEKGRTLVPARLFQEKASVRIDREG